jgi:DNA-directed RNA polymerase beta subunit
MPESILNQSPPQPAAISMRQFGDVDKTRELIFQNALSSAQSIKPVTNARYSLGLQNVAYDKPEEFSIADQKRALLERGTLTRPLHGTWVLSDPTGNKLAEHRTILARVPYMTPRGNFVLNGTSYTLAHQMRLLPGIYTRQQDNGEIEAHAPEEGHAVGFG